MSKNVSYETTTVCSLACPGCQRMTKEKYKSDWDKGDIPVDIFEKSLIGLDPKISQVNLTGCYGDAIYHKQFLDILDAVINSGLYWMITTCGANRPPSFWDNVATRDLSRARWIFSIDGLADTNHIYRKNARWETIDYAVRVITGMDKKPRRIEWKYIVFPYNEHQVEQAKQQAKEWNVDFFDPVKSDRSNLLYQYLPIAEQELYAWE